jgi:aminoglycoside phosphotransferase
MHLKLTAVRRPDDPDLFLYPETVEAALRRKGADDWSVDPGEFWTHVRPRTARPRGQGWKLHLSATPLSAPTVLARAADVLIDARVPFKFAGTPQRVADLVNGRVDRGSGGKFLTVYPDDDEQFRALAEALHHATRRLPGPGILSDRQYRPDSLVHYRYGSFGPGRQLTNDGTSEAMLLDPEGTPARDRRLGWFSPPAWAVPALPEPAAGRADAVLLNDRYEVRKALRHAYKGGVYLGTDRATGQDVVIKEARRHAGATLEGTDCGDLLRHEADMHKVLAPLGLTPRAVDWFTQGGNCYLVQEFITGQNLRSWVADLGEPALAAALDLAEQLVELVGRVHRLGLVIRDFTPNNLMVTPAGKVRLVDLEMVARPGDQVRQGYTVGYAGPEVREAETVGPAPEQSSDLFSLGSVLFHLLTGADLLFAADRPQPRGQDGRIAALVEAALADRPALRGFQPLVLGLTAADPEQRWDLDQVRHRLTGLRGTPLPAARARAAEPSRTPTDERPSPGPEAEHRLLSDGLAHLLATMTAEDPARLWPAEEAGATTDPLNVQHGAAGVLQVLSSAATHRQHDRLLDAVTRAAAWVAARTRSGERLLPGLYFGRSGTAWAMLDAALLTGDEALAAEATRLARAVPVRWPNPDVCHGTAGAGLTQLRFWQATGETVFRDRAAAAAEQVLGAARPGRHGVVWPVPADFDSQLAGITHLGFGHGVAGVGAFLLLAGLATDREDFVAAAEAAGATLLKAARVHDGAAGWPVDDANPAPTAAPNWCSGSSGVGTFLIRLWQATGDQRYRTAAEQAAAEVHRRRWQLSPAACHGLAGNAEFLLDLAAALGEQRYRRWASELVACAYARDVVLDGRTVVPDESQTRVSAGYNTGLSGMLGVLVRLNHGGTRLWIPDSLALPAPDPGLRGPRLARGGE